MIMGCHHNSTPESYSLQRLFNESVELNVLLFGLLDEHSLENVFFKILKDERSLFPSLLLMGANIYFFTME